MEGIVDICSFAEQQAKADSADSVLADSFVLVLGSKQGGKSTLVNAFLNPAKGALGCEGETLMSRCRRR
jgi:ABC-type uncharacterized transport system ATPase component